MPDVTALALLDLRTRARWRAWLAQHRKSGRGVWFVFHKAHTGVQSLPYEDFVREALCFGWIDSLVKRLDDDRFAITVTPRKPASKSGSTSPNVLRLVRGASANRLHGSRRAGGSV